MLCRIYSFKIYSNYQRFSSWFSAVQFGTPDPIYGLKDLYNADTSDKKLDLGVGVYRDDDGNSFILPSVKLAKDILQTKNLNHEYISITGDTRFTKKVTELLVGKNTDIIADEKLATVQTLSGTGALSVGSFFLKSFWPGNKCVFIPKPTWSNHNIIFSGADLKTKEYRYLNYKTITLDFPSLMDDICKIPKKSIVLLQCSSHNPTGVDPTTEQWFEISQAIKGRECLTFFDVAYLGFTSGDLEKDALPVRIFLNDGHQILAALSFSKNMGLYGERIGGLMIVCANKDEALAVLSQLNIIIRSLYSSPPINGAKIATEILSNETLYKQWLADLITMSCRMKDIRQKLKDELKCMGSCRDWEHITNQIGMFCFSGLSEKEIARLKSEFHIYLTAEGRISMAGVCNKNYQYLAEAIHIVTKS